MSYAMRMVLLAVFDAVIVSISFLIANYLRFEGDIPYQYTKEIPFVLPLTIGIHFISLYFFKLYRKVWLYASVGELISIIKALVIGSVAFYVVNVLVVHLDVPRSIYLISMMVSILLIGGSRFVWRLYNDNYMKKQPHQRRALIIGAGGSGSFVVKQLKHQRDAEFYPIGFIDDDPKKQRLEVLGVPVLGTRKEIAQVIRNYEIDDIVLAIPSAPKSEVAKIIDICKKTGARLRILPRVQDLIDGKISIQRIRDVDVEDLLGREPIKVDLEGIANYVEDKVVLVTGAGGSIGSELCRQVARFKPRQILLLGHGENSIYNIELELKKNFPDLAIEPLIAEIQDRDRIDDVFNQYRPNVVFHAAAHKHVPLMERNPSEAVKNNIFGTKNVAECAHKYEADRFVLISTDKAVNPTSVMGTTKRVAEMIIQSMDKVSKTKFVAVRFGNVLGSRGSVIPVFKRQIANGGPVTVTHPEMVRFFMTIPEAVQLVIQAGALANGGEVFILDMGEPVKIVDLARDLIRLSGFEPDMDIKIEFTGIRPGEKLYEEILTNEEGITATHHDRIFVAKPLNINREDLEFEIKKLRKVIGAEPAQIKEALQYIVPTFQNVS